MCTKSLYNLRQREGYEKALRALRPGVACLRLSASVAVAVGLWMLVPAGAAGQEPNNAPTVEPPNITIEAPAAIEGDELVFVIVGDKAAAGTIYYELLGKGDTGPNGELGDGVAMVGDDYQNPSATNTGGVRSSGNGTGTVRFFTHPDDQPREIRVPLTEDGVKEGDESIWLKLTFRDRGNLRFPRNAYNQERLTLWVEGTVSDKYYLVSVSREEGKEGETITFEVEAEGIGVGTVQYLAASGYGTHRFLPALKGEDFPEVEGTMTFERNGPRKQTVTVALTDDNLVENTEQFQLQLWNPTGSLLVVDENNDNRRAHGIGVINSEDTVKLKKTEAVKVEEGHTAEMSFTLERPLKTGESAQIRARVRRSCGTGSHQAEAGFDYASTKPHIFTFSKRNQTATLRIPILEDDLDEPEECFKVELAQAEAIGVDLSPQGSDFSETASFSVEVSITDNDDPPTFVFTRPEVIEPDEPNERATGTAELRFPIALDRPSGKTVTVKYAQGQWPGLAAALVATSGVDYEAISPGTLTFNPGEVLKHVTVTVKGDYLEELDEKVLLSLTQPGNACFPEGGSCGKTALLIGTIKNDDLNITLTLSFRDDRVPEGQNAELVGTLSHPVPELTELIFNIQALGAGETGGGTALLNQDYRLPAIELIKGVETLPFAFRAGETEKTLLISALADSVEGEGIETVNFKVVDVSVRKVGSGFVFIRTRRVHFLKEVFGPRYLPEQITADIDTPVLDILDGPALSVAPVKEKVTDGGGGASAARTARAGVDYVSQPSKRETIPAGETSLLLEVKTLQDTVDEWDQNFSVMLAGASVVLDESRALGIIRDNDPRPKMSISDAEGSEGSLLTFAVSLSAVSEKEITVGWHTEDATATVADHDYWPNQRQSVTFAPGDRSKDIKVLTRGDDRNELDEHFRVELFHAPEVTFSDNTGKGTIRNDDPVEFHIADALPVDEGADAQDRKANFVITMSTPQTKAITLQWETTTGVGGSDDIAEGDDGTTGILRDGVYIHGDKDFTPVSATPVTFAVGETEKTVSVTVLDDHHTENEENFGVVLKQIVGDNTKINFKRSTAYGTIRDNESDRIWIDSPTVIDEGNQGRKRVDVTVKRTDLFLDIDTDYRFLVCVITEGEDAGTATTPRSTDARSDTPPKIDAYLYSRTYFRGEECHIRGEAVVPYYQLRVGEDSFTFDVTVVGDRDPEENETFTLWIQWVGHKGQYFLPPKYRPGLRQTFTIVDNDTPQASISDASVSEDAAQVDLTIELSRKAIKDQKLYLVARDGTAKAGQDYQYTEPIEVPIKKGDKGKIEASISIPILSDFLDEGNEDFTLLLLEDHPQTDTDEAAVSELNVHPTGGTATVTIEDSRAPLLLTPPDRVVSEGDKATIEFKLTQRASISGGHALHWFPTTKGVNKPATPQEDFKSGDRNLHFPRGNAVPAPSSDVKLATKEDAIPEPDENVGIALKVQNDNEIQYRGYIAGAQESGHLPLVIIRDDDSGSLQTAGLGNGTVKENETWTSPDLPTVSGRPMGDPTWTIEGDDAAQFSIDPDTGQLKMSAQNFEKAADQDKNNTYEVTVRATDEDGNTHTQSVTVTVEDVVTTYLVKGTNAVDEGKTITFTVTPTRGKPGIPLSLKWQTAPDETGTKPATAGRTIPDPDNPGGTIPDPDNPDDYTPTSEPQTLTWAESDSSSKTLTVATAKDDLNDPSETFLIKLSEPVHQDTDDAQFKLDDSVGTLDASKTTAQYLVTIKDLPLVSVGDVSVTEGDDPSKTTDMTFTVSLSAVSQQPVTVEFSLGGSATAGSDYTAPDPLSVTIAAGSKTGSIVVPVKGDVVDEPDEKVIVTLTKATNAYLSDAEEAVVGEGTITDDDAAPAGLSVTVDPSSVSEGGGEVTVTVTVTLSGTSVFAEDQEVGVFVANPKDTAELGSDYHANLHIIKDLFGKPVRGLFEVTIPATELSGSDTFLMTPINDKKDETDETFTILAFLSAGDQDETLVTITDDDGPAVSVANAAAVAEGDDPTTTADMTFEVSLSKKSPQPVTVTYTLGGSAAAGSDYTAPDPLSLTIPAGDSSGSIVVPIKGDVVDEPDETVLVNLSGATNATLSTAQGATLGSGTITDDDDPPTKPESTDGFGCEGG